jgi:hypothetical protein
MTRLARLLAEFAKATDYATRDRLALNLADTMEDEAKAALVKALRDPSTSGHRGTLVYALMHFNCTDIVPELVESIISGSYEECEHGVAILHGLDPINDVPADVRKAAFERFTDAIRWTAGWRRTALRDCAAMFRLTV